MHSPRVRSPGRRALVLLAALLGGCSDPPPEAGDSASSSEGPSTGPELPPLTSSSSSSGAAETSIVDGTGTSSSTGATTGDSQDCCAAHPDPGCEDPELVACVCKQEAFCCAFGWDAGCVALAEQCGGCGAATGTTGSETTTGPEPGLCCTPLDEAGCAEDPGIEACVCGLDAFCCDTQWDDQCVGTAVRQCGAACEMVGGDCCSPAALPGCPADPIVETCVCGLDGFCCDEQWDGMCVEVAENDCGLECNVGGGGDCCTANGTPGCDDPAVQDCVCMLDGYCCDNEWDGICVSEAQYACMDECGLPPANMGDCCMEQPGPGCADMAVTDCTCMIDGGCCLNPWDDQCIQIAVTACAIMCEGVEPLDPCCLVQDGPTCGNLEVETCVCAFDPFCCDTQWDGICVDEAQNDCMLDCSGGGGGTGGSGGSSTT